MEWSNTKKLEDFQLPKRLKEVTGQTTVKFGVAIVRLNDTEFAHEICQEMFTPESPAIEFCLDGAEIILNSSGSHHQLRKLNTRLNLILNSSFKSGGVYVYSNQQGCDGGRLYFDGSSLIALNGRVVSQGSQFSIKERELVLATVDLDEVRHYRRTITCKSIENDINHEYHRVYINFDL
mmetsp:Transcript_8760/g.9947  ORF Transcript_8760/g.9947 Transcript_8760/m.9947 type:complete len:179 (-) Transcript_8760:1202-1738(-)